MACLELAEAAVNAAKLAAAPAKADYESEIDSLRSLDPSNYDTRAEFDAAKDSAISTTKGALTSYISGIEAVNLAAEAIDVLTAVKMDALAVATTLANTDLFGLIPLNPLMPLSIAAALLKEETLQCSPL